MLKYLLPLFSLVAILDVNAQKIVTGSVQDTEGAPVPYCNVVVYADSIATRIGTTTSIKGLFELRIDKKIANMYLKIDRLGYEAQNILLPFSDTLIVLKAKDMYIEEVEIAGRRKFSQVSNEGVLYTIKNSVLSTEASTFAVLSKIPGLTGNGSRVSTIYGETPTIYVDGRKLYSNEELKNIAPTRIRSIELIENPGAKFGSEEKAVIEIKTYKKTDGFDLFWSESVSKNKFWSHAHNINANYNVGKLNFSGVFEYSDQGLGSKQHRYLKNTYTSIWENYLDLNALKNRNRSLSMMFSINYNISDKHSVGAMYNHRKGRLNSRFELQTETFQDGAVDDEIEGSSLLNDRNTGDLINLFYIGKLGGKTQLKVFADYLHQGMKRRQTVDEVSTLTADQTLTSLYSPSNYDIYALKALLSHTINDKHSFTAGADVSKVSGDGHTNYISGEVSDSKYKLSERKIAGFADYTLSFEPLTLVVGLRYESVHAQNKDLITPSLYVSRNYDNLLPSLNLRSTIGKTQQSLSYSARITRPSFAWLGSYSSYINVFQREDGNPNLKPQLSHNIQYRFFYKDLNLSFTYNYIKDFMAMNIVNDPQNPEVSVFTWANYKKRQSIRIFANYSKRFGFYEPIYTATYIQPFFKLKYEDIEKRVNRPTFFVELDNYLHITPLCTLNLNYTYISGGVAQIYTMKSVHRFDASINYQFFKRSLVVQLSIQDMFNRDIDRQHSSINNTYIRTLENNYRRNIRLNISWRFNRTKASYKGQSAGESEMDRL